MVQIDVAISLATRKFIAADLNLCTCQSAGEFTGLVVATNEFPDA
jgi:hypothetical protein